MNKYFDLHFNRNVVIIYPGEFYVSSGPELISTVLGSCVSIVLYDPIAAVGGMNHYMLAKDTSAVPDKNDRLLGRFGEYAMEMLISSLEKKGTVLSRCIAKVFGGGNIFNSTASDGKDLVGESNIKFAFDFLRQHNIEVRSSDTGGILPRKIFFDPTNYKVFVKLIDNKNSEESKIEESKERKQIEYLAELNRLSKEKKKKE